MPIIHTSGLEGVRKGRRLQVKEQRSSDRKKEERGGEKEIQMEKVRKAGEKTIASEGRMERRQRLKQGVGKGEGRRYRRKDRTKDQHKDSGILYLLQLRSRLGGLALTYNLLIQSENECDSNLGQLLFILEQTHHLPLGVDVVERAQSGSSRPGLGGSFTWAAAFEHPPVHPRSRKETPLRTAGNSFNQAEVAQARSQFTEQPNGIEIPQEPGTDHSSGAGLIATLGKYLLPR